MPDLVIEITDIQLVHQPFMAEWQKTLKTEFTLKYDVVRARVRGFVCQNRLQMFTNALID